VATKGGDHPQKLRMGGGLKGEKDKNSEHPHREIPIMISVNGNYQHHRLNKRVQKTF